MLYDALQRGKKGRKGEKRELKTQFKASQI